MNKLLNTILYAAIGPFVLLFWMITHPVTVWNEIRKNSGV